MNATVVVPRIIHNTWKTNKLPAEWQYARKQCMKAHPGYDFMLWTDESARAMIAKVSGLPKCTAARMSRPITVKPLYTVCYGVPACLCRCCLLSHTAALNLGYQRLAGMVSQASKQVRPFSTSVEAQRMPKTPARRCRTTRITWRCMTGTATASSARTRCACSSCTSTAASTSTWTSSASAASTFSATTLG